MSEKTYPLGDDCDLTTAWMAGSLDARRKMEAERDTLRAKVERLQEALRNRLNILDATIAENGRGIEWDQEDAFRMGEWFEDEDLAAVDAARAARAALGGEA